MHDLTPFALAVLALLAAPGPTNALLAAAGAQQGVRRSLPLLGSALVGYLIALLVWMELVGTLAASQPWVPVAAKMVAAGFLLWSAWKLWASAGRAGLEQRGITPTRMFTTTLINPKALVFAFALFPSGDLVSRLPYLGVFSALVVATALGWMVLGMLAARSSGGLMTASRVEKMTAIALAVFAVALVVQTVSGLL